MKVIKSNRKIYYKTVKDSLPSYIVSEKSNTRRRYLVALRETKYTYKAPKRPVPSFEELATLSKESFTLI